MSYFNPAQETKVIVDASPVGLGGLLAQDGKVISYASRALSDVESRYSQTEREMRAIVWALEHFHLYLYGSEFTIMTDHKPLLGIFNSHKPTSARMDRWKLRLMPYKCHLVYRPGKDAENPADFMSRHPNLQATAKRNVADEYVYYVCSNAIPKAMTLQEIQSETEKDPTLQSLIKAIETDRWTDSEILDYKRLKDELLVYSGVVLRGNRIVVPSKLRERAVDLAHVGHQGIVKTKSLIREKVWFPGIDKMVKDKVDNCLACQTVTPSKSSRIEPLQMTPLPSGPWKMLAMDFLGPFPSGDYLLVVIDEYSRFPEVEIVKSMSAKSVIPRLDAIFARQGISQELKTDNGPPFNGVEFSNFDTFALSRLQFLEMTSNPKSVNKLRPDDSRTSNLGHFLTIISTHSSFIRAQFERLTSFTLLHQDKMRISTSRDSSSQFGKLIFLHKLQSSDRRHHLLQTRRFINKLKIRCSATKENILRTIVFGKSWT